MKLKSQYIRVGRYFILFISMMILIQSVITLPIHIESVDEKPILPRTMNFNGTQWIANPTKLNSDNESWNGDYIYYGNYYRNPEEDNPDQAPTLTFSEKQPLKWKVLDNTTIRQVDENNLSSEDGQILLMTDEIVDNIGFEYSTAITNLEWSQSNLRKWLNSDSGTVYSATSGANLYQYTPNGFYETAFDKKEQALISPSYGKVSQIFQEAIGTKHFNDTSIDGAKIFCLTSGDMVNENYGYYSGTTLECESRKQTATYYARSQVNAGDRWLRSKTVVDGKYGIFHYNTVVSDDGKIYQKSNSDFWTGVSPAMNIDPSKIVMVSDASLGISKKNMTEIKQTEIHEWKLTLQDSNRHFQLDTSMNVPLKASAGDTLDINYAPASVSQGQHEYVSAMVVNDKGTPDDTDDEILYYGQIDDLTSTVSGKAQLKLPQDIDAGTYKLYIFSENNRGAYYTNYISNFEELTLNIEKKIPSVAVTVTVPVAGSEVNKSGATKTEGIKSEVLEVTWLKDGNTYTGTSFAYNTSYKAKVILETKNNYLFDNTTTATINGYTANITHDSDTQITITYSFQTNKAKLEGIVSPDSLSLKNGTLPSSIISQLPTTVEIQTEDVDTTSALVSWDTSALATLYDPAHLEKQTITINGVVTLPTHIDQNSISLNASIQVVIEEAGTVTKPVANILSGTYDQQQHVSLSCTTQNATIYYTTDGSDPYSHGIAYTQPIVVTEDTTIKAVAKCHQMKDSDISIFNYLIHVPKVTGISITPNHGTLEKDHTLQLHATVYGEYQYNQNVIWEVSGHTSRATQIDQNGILVIGKDEKSSKVNIKVTSVGNPQYFANAEFDIVEPTYELKVMNGTGSGEYSATRSIKIKADYISGYQFHRWQIVEGEANITNAKNSETTLTMLSYQVSVKATYTKIINQSSSHNNHSSQKPEITKPSQKEPVNNQQDSTQNVSSHIQTSDNDDQITWSVIKLWLSITMIIAFLPKRKRS